MVIHFLYARYFGRHQQWTQKWNATVSFTGKSHRQQWPWDFYNNVIMEVEIGYYANLKKECKQWCLELVPLALRGLKQVWSQPGLEWEPISKRKKSERHSTHPINQKPFFKTVSHYIIPVSLNFWLFCLGFLSARVTGILRYVLPNNWVSFLHFCVCVCVPVYRYMHVQMSMLGVRGQPKYFVLETVLLTGLGLIK